MKLEPNRVYTAELTLKTDHAEEGAQVTVPIFFSVTPPAMTGIWMEEIPAQDYTSKKIMPEVEVYWGGTLLTKNDYTVSYKNNVNAYSLTDGQEGFDAKKAPTITIKGKGNYKGTFTRTFVINQADLTTQATAENVKLKYTGKNLKPTTTVTAKLGGQTVKLRAGTDFVYEYDPLPYGDAPGTRYVTIKPKSGNFKGSQQFRVDIIDGVPMSKVSVAKIKDVRYGIDSHVPVLTVKYGKVTLTPGIDYTVSYKNNYAVGTASVTITGTEKLPPPEGHNTYFGTITKTFKITGTSISGAKLETTDAFQKSFDYDGTAKTQPAGSFKLTLSKGTVVVPESCYTVTYEKNVNPGTAKMIFTGRPEKGYTGKLTKTFRITGYDISGGHITVHCNNGTEQFWSPDPGSSPAFPYNLGGVKPEPVVKFKGTVLEKGRDYTVSWSNNNAVKTDLSAGKKIPTVTIKGRGSFKGTITRIFKIEQKPFDNANVTVIAADVQWRDKNGCNPKVTILEKSTGKALKAGTDYYAATDKFHPFRYEFVSVPSGAKVYNYDKTTKTRTEVSLPTNPDGEPVLQSYVIPEGCVIRVIIKGKGAYSEADIKTIFKFVKREVSITGSAFKITIPEQQWTGKPIELKEGDITVTHKVSKTETKTLKLGTDYEIVPGSYLNNINRGTAKVTIRGLNNGTTLYGGTKQVSFKIVQRRMNYVIKYDKNEEELMEMLWIRYSTDEKHELELKYGNKETWFEKNYRITGTMKDSSTPYGGRLSANAYKLQRYNEKSKKWVNVTASEVEFMGWATGKGKILENKDVFKPSWFWKLTYDDSVTLYAAWDVK